MTRFVVIVTTYNSEKWIGKNLDSLGSQVYCNWKGIVVNDCSTDNTQEVIKRHLPKKMLSRITNQRRGALHNQVTCVKDLYCEDEDVIVIVDGDDWLPDKNTFDRLSKVYEYPKIWLTYGSYEIFPRKRISDKTRPATEHDDPRTGPMIYRHLRTFKYFLWKNIKDETLRDDSTGEYFFYGTDSVVMRPMVEMAGLIHIHHISDKMYVYNFTDALSSRKDELKQHNVCCGQIGRQERYVLKTKEELIVCDLP